MHAVERDRHPSFGFELPGHVDLDAALRDVAGCDIFGALGSLQQGRAGHLDSRHAPALARLADDVLSDQREDIDLLVEAKPHLGAVSPGDDAVERHAVHQLELEALPDRDLVIDMEDRAAGAELADRADLADAARGHRARPQGVAVRLPEPGIEPRHIRREGIDDIHAHAFRIGAGPKPPGARIFLPGGLRFTNRVPAAP